MEKYWKNRPRAPPTPTATTTTGDTESATATASVRSDFDRYRLTLLAADEAEGWEAELQRYLKDMPADVMPETDIILWWQVRKLFLFNLIVLNVLYYKQQNNHKLYPTLGRIALDILPIPASSVPCERLFSAAKEIADDRRSRLGPKTFEELQIMKFAWRNNIPDLAAWNSGFVEEVDLDEFRELLWADNWQNAFDGNELDEAVEFHDDIVEL